MAEVPVEVGINDGVQGRVQIAHPNEKVHDPRVLLGDHFSFMEHVIGGVTEEEKFSSIQLLNPKAKYCDYLSLPLFIRIG